MSSDFIWNFRKLPFPSHFGKYFIRIGKISDKIHENGKINAIFGLGMTPIYGLKNVQIKSLMSFKASTDYTYMYVLINSIGSLQLVYINHSLQSITLTG